MGQVVSRVGSMLWSGTAVGLLSAASFGIAGALGKPLLHIGWTPAAVTLLRVGGGALVLLPWVLCTMRGRWNLLPGSWLGVVAYGLLGVAGAQLAYFSAVETLPVAVALLLEYSAVVLVVGWMWMVHGQRPSRFTVAGVVVCVSGLVLVLGLLTGADISLPGVAWALAAAVGLAAYFVLSADEQEDTLPPMALAGLGLAIGALALVVAAAFGLVTLRASSADIVLGDVEAPWWLPGASLALVAAAVSYSTGIIAARRLGARLMSFLGLTEVLFAVAFAWLLLGEQPTGIQVAGGLLLIAGVVVVRLGETGVTLQGDQAERDRAMSEAAGTSMLLMDPPGVAVDRHGGAPHDR